MLARITANDNALLLEGRFHFLQIDTKALKRNSALCDLQADARTWVACCTVKSFMQE